MSESRSFNGRSRSSFACGAAAVMALALVAGVVGSQPQSRGLDTDVRNAIDERWGDRLGQLRENRPGAYFDLAEEIDDVRGTGPAARGTAYADAERRLVRQLFALAGQLDGRLAPAAARAIADVTEDSRERRRLLVIAGLLEEDRLLRGRPLRIDGVPTGRGVSAPPAVLHSATAAIARYRLGDGEESLEELADHPQRFVAAAFDSWPGGLRGFEQDCRREPGTPEVRRLLAELSAELRMLEGVEASFGSIVRAGGGTPLEEVDVTDLERLFGVDRRRSVWRDGAWTER